MADLVVDDALVTAYRLTVRTGAVDRYGYADAIHKTTLLDTWPPPA
jgi:hypothetical protein